MLEALAVGEGVEVGGAAGELPVHPATAASIAVDAAIRAAPRRPRTAPTDTPTDSSTVLRKVTLSAPGNSGHAVPTTCADRDHSGTYSGGVAPSPSRRTPAVARRLSVGAVVLMLTLPLAACSDGGEVTDPRAGDDSSRTTTTSPGTPEPSRSGGKEPSPSVATGTGSPTAPAPLLGRRAPTLRHRLLTAEQLPRLAPRTEWRGTGVSVAEQEDFALCHPFALSAIGADRVRLRSFVDAQAPTTARGQEAARASHLLAGFPDRRTTRRAAAVLDAWHEQCEKRLSRTAHRAVVGELTSVEGLAGPASWYRTKLRLRAEAVPVIEVTGSVRVGSRIGVVVLRHRKGAYAPSAGEDEIVAALTRAAAALS